MGWQTSRDRGDEPSVCTYAPWTWGERLPLFARQRVTETVPEQTNGAGGALRDNFVA